MSNERPSISHVLVLPNVRIQSANAISSPMTWGFPAMTAFTGLMSALKRRLGAAIPFEFRTVGVICHDLQAQVATSKHEYSFCLTRNPADKDGNPPAIVEEGRVHLEVTLVFGLYATGLELNDLALLRKQAQEVVEALAGMRVAGGSVMPSIRLRHASPALLSWPLHYKPDEHERAWRRLSRRWLPGFALVARDDLLAKQLLEIRKEQPNATLLEVWLHTIALTYRAHRINTTEDTDEHIEWRPERPPGWIVPIPVGYAALSELHAPGAVTRARDTQTPFRFVESVYSLGQWISPHRLGDATDLMWWPDHDPVTGLYRCRNAYQPPVPAPISAEPDASESSEDPESPFAYV